MPNQHTPEQMMKDFSQSFVATMQKALDELSTMVAQLEQKVTDECRWEDDGGPCLQVQE